MATVCRRTVLVSALVLVLGLVLTASEATRRLPFYFGKDRAVEQSGKCLLGVWSQALEEGYPSHLLIRAGILAPRSCEPVEIKIEAIYDISDTSYTLEAMPGPGNTKPGVWKVVSLAGSQVLKRATVEARLDLEKIFGRLGPGDVVYVKVTVRCKHGTTVEIKGFYWYA